MRISRNVAVFLSVALVAAGGVLAWRAFRPGPTDEERIRALVDATARAVEERKPGDVMAGVSERFQADGMGHRELRQLVTYEVLRGSWNAVVPVATRVEVAGDRAEAVVDAALVRGARGPGVLGKLPESADTWRFEIALEREKEGWKVVSGRWRPVSAREGLTGERP
ncbi:MAG TPA: hypothetical protein VFM45_04730 [Anaeromyxobacteraceae bacterium]|nr:hypothetical protein [Anaeromyxobacteraceae bacterium]